MHPRMQAGLGVVVGGASGLARWWRQSEFPVNRAAPAQSFPTAGVSPYNRDWFIKLAGQIVMWIWFGMAALALIGEVSSGTFYLLLVALGMVMGGIIAAMGLDLEWQIAACGAVALGGLVILRKLGVLKKRGVNSARNSDVHMDIGQTVMVDAWSDNGTTRVLYRGAMWQAELCQGQPRETGQHVITEMRGTSLVLAPQKKGHA